MPMDDCVFMVGFMGQMIAIDSNIYGAVTSCYVLFQEFGFMHIKLACME
jgi:hypothetical protein